MNLEHLGRRYRPSFSPTVVSKGTENDAEMQRDHEMGLSGRGESLQCERKKEKGKKKQLKSKKLSRIAQERKRQARDRGKDEMP